MSEASKPPRKGKKKLPDNVIELPDKEVAKLLFGKRAARAIEEELEAESESDKDNDN